MHLGCRRRRLSSSSQLPSPRRSPTPYLLSCAWRASSVGAAIVATPSVVMRVTCRLHVPIAECWHSRHARFASAAVAATARTKDAHTLCSCADGTLAGCHFTGTGGRSAGSWRYGRPSGGRADGRSRCGGRPEAVARPPSNGVCDGAAP